MAFIMERLPGVAVPQKILGDDSYADARSALVQQMADSLARVHNVSTAALPPLPLLTAADQLARFRAIVDGCDLHHSGLEVAFSWLDARQPTESTATLVHGDFRLGNVIVDHSGLSGIIDWELAHIGDPMSDLGWLCMRSWRFSRPELPAAGLGCRAWKPWGAVRRICQSRQCRRRRRARTFLGSLRQRPLGGDLPPPGAPVPRRFPRRQPHRARGDRTSPRRGPEALRSGEIDWHRIDIQAHVRKCVEENLLVSNPRWLR